MSQIAAVQDFGGKVFAGLVAVNAVSDARRKGFGPLPHSVVAEPETAGGFGNRAVTDYADGVVFKHATLHHSFNPETRVATTVREAAHKMPAMETFGERLAHALELASVSREKLADHLGVSVQAVSKVIRGGSSALTAANAAEAARFLGVDLYWLATGKGGPVAAPAVDPDELDARTWRETARDCARQAGQARLTPEQFLRVVDFVAINPQPQDTLQRSAYVRQLMEMIGAV